MKWCVKFWD